MDLNLREEALSHGSGDAARASPQLSGDQSRSSADDQRARGGYVLPLGGPTSGEAQVPHQQAGPEATAPDAWRGAMPPNPQFAGMPSVPAYPPSQGQAAIVKPEPTPEPPVAPAPVPLQPRPAAYSFPAGPGGSGLSGSGAMSIPPRPSSSASHGKARSNSWSYPASAVSPYAYPYPSASAAAAAGGMPALERARGSSQRYRYRGLSLSDDDVRQQQLQSGPFLSAQQPQQAQQHQDQFLYGGVDQAAAFFQSSVPGQAPGTGPPTPPLPTTPSSFIRRTSLPQTYLHTIPIARPPTPMSSFAASASIDSATIPGVPSGLQPTPPPRQEEKLEIPTHGTRALPKEIASHPAIQSITKTNPDQPTVAEGEEGEKEHGTEASPVEESGGALAPGAMHAGEGKFVDITEYLNLPQSKVAKTLGIPSSTLSKRWKEAARARKWPWRTVCKIDKEIIALLHNISPAVTAKGPEHVPPEIHSRLLTLLKQRQDELKPVIIRL